MTLDFCKFKRTVPYKDKSNIGRYSQNDLKCRGNVWKIGYETIQKSSDKWHPDMFPLKLPEMCIKLSGVKNGIVLDFFGGSGTTGIGARNLGLSAILIDKNPIYKEVFENRCKKKFGTETVQN